jgi:hypothetical protein
MMKKILIILGVLAGMAIVAYLSLRWYAAREVMHRIASRNSIVIQQRLYQDHYTQLIDFKSLERTHYYLQPAVEFRDVVYTLTYMNMPYIFRADKVTLVAGLGDTYEYTVKLPDSAVLELQGKPSVNLKLTEVPVMEIKAERTRQEEWKDVKKDPLNAVYISEIKIDPPKPLQIEISREDKSFPPLVIETQLYPRNVWHKPSYRFYEPATALLGRIAERVKE